MEMTKSKAIFIIALIGIAGTSVGLVLYDQFGRPADVRIGYLGGDLHQLAYYVAMRQGFYAEAGVRVQGIPFANGGEVMVAFEAAARGIDIAYLGIAPAVYHRFNNPAAQVTVLAAVNVNGTAIVARNDPAIQGVADLKGKRVAVPARNNMQDFVLSMALNAYGLTAQDVTIVANIAPSDMLLALAKDAASDGAIDAFVAWEPFPARAAIGVGAVGKTLTLSSTFWPNHPCCVLAADNGFTVQHRDVVKKVLAVHKQATEWIWAHPAEAKQIAMSDMNLSDEQASAAMANVGFVYDPYMPGYVQFLDKMVALNPGVTMSSPNIPAGMTTIQFIDYFVNASILHGLA